MNWHDQAACAKHPHPEWWIGGDGTSSPDERRDHFLAAVQVCLSCPALIECGEQRQHEVTDGVVWAGIMPDGYHPALGRTGVCAKCETEFTYARKGPRRRWCSDQCRRMGLWRQDHGRPISDREQAIWRDREMAKFRESAPSDSPTIHGSVA